MTVSNATLNPSTQLRIPQKFPTSPLKSEKNHTIKGTSGFLAYPNLEHLAHVGENLLVLLHDGALRLNAEIATALLAMGDAVRSILGRIESAGTEGDETYEGLIATLERLKNREPAATPAASAVATPQQIEIDVEQVVRELSQEVQAAVACSPADCKLAAQSVRKPRATAKSKPKTKPPASSKPADSTNSELKTQIEHHLEATLKLEADSHSDTTFADSAAVAIEAAAHDDHAATHAVSPKKTSATADSRANADGGSAAAEGGDKSGSVTDSSVRIDVQLLDKLMNLVGELVLARNQIVQFSGIIQDAAMSAASQRLNLITTELQAGVMKTRMQPIRNAWAKLPRVVRDLSLSCGKKIQVVMEGEDTELDKTILEAIKDPLTHIVRNSVDHGIESSDVRVKNGKPAEGTLWLRASHEGGQVIIEIADDGGGIPLDRVREKAVEKGLGHSRAGGRDVRSRIDSINTSARLFDGCQSHERLRSRSRHGCRENQRRKDRWNARHSDHDGTRHDAANQDSAHAGDHSRSDCDDGR